MASRCFDARERARTVPVRLCREGQLGTEWPDDAFTSSEDVLNQSMRIVVWWVRVVVRAERWSTWSARNEKWWTLRDVGGRSLALLAATCCTSAASHALRAECGIIESSRVSIRVVSV